jgi:O-antigen/teichoic acid export membrane protein
MTLKAKVAHGLKWQVISIIGRQLVSLVVFTTLARLLSPSAFGLVALAAVYLGIVTMFIDQGITQALIQRQDLEAGHKDAAFWFNLVCATILCLSTIVLAGPVAALFKEPRLVPLLRWSSLGLVIGASTMVHSALFIRAMDFRQPVIRGLIASLFGGIIGIGMAFMGFGVWSLVGQQLASELAGAIFLWIMSTYRPSFEFSKSHLRQLFRFSSSIFATSILWYFSSRLDEMVIGRFAGINLLGLYSIAGKLPNLANMVTQQPLSIVSLPSLSKLQSDHAKMRHVVCQGMELNALISFAVFVGLAMVSPEAVHILFGAKWAGAALLCSLLSIYAMVNTLGIFCYPILLASGGIGKFVWLNVWHASGVLAACVIGIQFSIIWLVVGLIINSVVMTVPGLIYVHRRIGLSPLDYCRPCLIPAAASLFMAGTVWSISLLMPQSTWVALLLFCKMAAGAAAYLGFMFIFRRNTLIKLLEMGGHVIGFNFKTPVPVAPPSAGN